MTPWMMRRAKTAWLLGLIVALAGFFAVLVFVLQAFLPATLLPELPRLPAVSIEGSLSRMPLNKAIRIPHELYAGLAVAIFGLLTMLCGATIARRQVARLEAVQRGTEDRMRRVQQYAGEERVEPYLGDTITIDVDAEPK